MVVVVDACNVQWHVDVEVLRGDEEEEACDFAVTPVVYHDNNSEAYAVTLKVTPLHPVLVKDMHLLVVVTARRAGKAVFRVAGWVTADTHNQGPYDVFATDATVAMESDDAIADMRCFYTRAMPRCWTQVEVAVHSSVLKKLLA